MANMSTLISYKHTQKLARAIDVNAEQGVELGLDFNVQDAVASITPLFQAWTGTLAQETALIQRD